LAVPDDPTPVRVLLARHGQTADNAGGLILGHRDPPLTAAGRCQAAELARAAVEARIAAIWSSPLQRARVTAETVAEATGAPITIDEDLIESDRGDWEGRPLAELADAEPERFAAFLAADPSFVFPGGESLADQVARTRRALDRAAAGPQPALVVAHVGTIRAALIATGVHPPPEADVPHGELVAVGWAPAQR
jgi:ribonuclease H / adenosylcobalamin/alpha-ribazole phosphatase